MDTNYKIFGASNYMYINEQTKVQTGHQYESIPIKEDEVMEWESELMVSFPQEYREYLKKIGYGAGPSYGLLNLEKIMDYTTHYYSPYAEEANDEHWNFYDEDFNLESGYGQITYFRDMKRKHITRYRKLLHTPLPENTSIQERDRYYAKIIPRVISMEGAIIIVNGGGASFDALVVEGELAGTVWWIDGACGSSFRAQPYGFIERQKIIPNAKMPFTFLEYMEHWMDSSIKELVT